MEQLFLLGLNHLTAPIELRERLAFDQAAATAYARTLIDQHLAREAVVLSTCNRVELYLDLQADAGAVEAHLARCRSVDPLSLVPHLYRHAGRDAVRHLFEVASSLDSMVLGEAQIVGQVRDAYDASVGASATGPTLDPLFQRAIATGKQVLTETALGEGRQSVAGVAVAYASEIFDDWRSKIVLCVGAGKMSALVLKAFSQLGPGSIRVVNRDVERGRVLASRFEGTGHDFSSLESQLVEADVVITSTAATTPVVTLAMMSGVMRRRRRRPIFMLDIALPRDIDARAGELEDVFIYNLDDLQRGLQQAGAGRQDSLDAARAIVDQGVRQYVAWHRQRLLGPMIEQLYARSYATARIELDRYVRAAGITDEAEKRRLDELMRRTVNKLLHGPIRTLREAQDRHADDPAATHEAMKYVHAVTRLFELGEGAGRDATRAGPREADPPGD
jgi:glutamyl-tRNA reductase